jgi:hypothetical protein
MAKNRRRAFLTRTSLISAGSAAGLNSAAVLGQSKTDASANSVVSFGWEVVNLQGNGADVYFRVAHSMRLHKVNIDVAFMITSGTANPGFAEVLCQGSVSRNAAPNFDNSQGPAYLPVLTSPVVTVHNPNNLTIINNPTLGQDCFYSVILKTWVPTDGTASATSRHVFAAPSLALDAGDYLVFHMDHAGVAGDGEMQVVLTYALI